MKSWFHVPDFLWIRTHAEGNGQWYRIVGLERSRLRAGVPVSVCKASDILFRAGHVESCWANTVEHNALYFWFLGKHRQQWNIWWLLVYIKNNNFSSYVWILYSKTSCGFSVLARCGWFYPPFFWMLLSRKPFTTSGCKHVFTTTRLMYCPRGGKPWSFIHIVGVAGFFALKVYLMDVCYMNVCLTHWFPYVWICSVAGSYCYIIRIYHDTLYVVVARPAWLSRLARYGRAMTLESLTCWVAMSCNPAIVDTYWLKVTPKLCKHLLRYPRLCHRELDEGWGIYRLKRDGEIENSWSTIGEN